MTRARWHTGRRGPVLAPAVLVVGLAAACGAGVVPPAATAPVASVVPSHAPTAGPTGPIGLAEAGLPTLPPEAVRERVPTRVVVPRLDIDLAVVEPPVVTSSRFPYCGVAEFMPTMSRPGRPGTTFLYAHARVGMFLPILEASRIRDGRSMLGMRVDVYTSDDRRFTYEVDEVLRHMTSLDFAYRATAEQLILQTSEGPHGTPGKTMLVAHPVDEVAATPAEAHPIAKPIRCS